MKSKTWAIIYGIGLSVVCLSSQADEGYYDRARVVKVKPIYEIVEISHPEERCWNETVYHSPRNRTYTPSITGAIVGGAIGNRFGSGHGKDAMTVAGALLGASIGNDISNKKRRSGYQSTERRCETIEHVEEQEELVGYRVKYRYKGQTGWMRTKHHPGKHIQVRVSVEPMGRY